MLRHVIEHVKEGLVAHVATLFGPPFGEVFRTPGSTWVMTGDVDPYRNGILEARLGDGPPEEEVGRLLAPFTSRRQPMMWWFFTGSEGLDPAVHTALRARGLRLDSDRPAMTLPLGDRAEIHAPEGLDIRRVASDEDFEVWLDVVEDAFGTPDRHSSLSTRSFRHAGFGEDAPFQHYVSRYEGGPAGAATLTRVGPTVSLGNIATRRDLQRRGIAYATVGRALEEAARRGVTLASLSADPAGTRLYTKLGFRTVGRHLTYVWQP
jgi:GNAT superfamily N-acetyltransferase